MRNKKEQPPSGEIRQSQIVTMFGPGAMIDLPTTSVLISGLEHWFGDKKPVYEERLEQCICRSLEIESIKMFAPPVDEDTPHAPRTGIPVFSFPRWFVAQITEDDLRDVGISWRNSEFRCRPLVSSTQLVAGGQYLTRGRQKRAVVPVRFVQACPNGHLSDLDWWRFAHGETSRRCDGGQLWLEEGGSGGDLSQIFVRCEGCDSRRSLGHAKIPDKPILGNCQGHRPWLGPTFSEPCVNPNNGKPEFNRLLVRSGSHAYFSQQLRVISIPEADKELMHAVDRVYEDFLQYAESLDDLSKERKKQKVANALEKFSNEQVWAEVERRKAGSSKSNKSIKQAEIETLLSSPVSVGEDVPNGDFYARTRPLHTLVWEQPNTIADKIHSMVLVHRLREVVAQIGFTRFESPTPNLEGELDLGVRLAPLAQELRWVPAVEHRGEGIFLSFRPEAIQTWLERPAVQNRRQQLLEGFVAWRRQKGREELPFLELPYIMLHSLSHLLIQSVSLECGYAATAIRERVYAGESGYGILLYTGTSGAEGTLGGLVQVGHRIEHYLQTALEMGRLCSNDPVCSQHTPAHPQEQRFLHGAACHGCLLIAETSCESFNHFLDRALVVETVDAMGAAFFA